MKIIDVEKIIKISLIDCLSENLDLIDKVNKYLSDGWVLIDHNFGTSQIETYLLGYPRSNSSK